MQKIEFETRKEFQGARAFLTIPASLAMDEDLLKKPKSLILLGHIVSMLNVTQAFYMSNKVLAERLRVSKPTVNDYLNLLESKNIIIREKIYDDNTGAILGRNISAGPALIKACSMDWAESLASKDSAPSKVDLTTPSKVDLTTPSKADLTTLVKSTLHKENIIKEQFKIDDDDKAEEKIRISKHLGNLLNMIRNQPIYARERECFTPNFRQLQTLRFLVSQLPEESINELKKEFQSKIDNAIPERPIDYLIQMLKNQNEVEKYWNAN